MPVLSVSNRFDISKTQRNIQANRYDAVMADRLARCSLLFKSGSNYNSRYVNRFDAENITSDSGAVIRFASEGRGLCKTSGLFDAVRVFDHPTTGVTGKFTLTRSWDTGTIGRFQTIRPSRQMATARFDAIIFLKYMTTSGLFDAKTKMLKTLSNFFDIMPGYQRVKISGLFDTIATTTAALPMHKQAFVQSGWWVLVRNLETNEPRNLGFIELDAAEKKLTDVEIPNGDYEITLLYSSLFWQNAVDRVVRNVTIRSGEEPTLGLPPILNLRSEIENGITRILWDSEPGFDGVTFGLWFGSVRTLHSSSFPPPLDRFVLLRSPTPANSVSGFMATERQLHPAVVPHDREPDQTVAYTISELEYEFAITQSLPMWCVVMAIKGNMHGPASEIFLPWSNESPRRPDDQMAFDDAVDFTKRIEQSEHEQTARRDFATATGQDGDENPEWDTSKGYW